MRNILLGLILILIFSVAAAAQPVTATFTQAEADGISFTKLDSLYPSAAHGKPGKGVFKEKQPQFLKQYKTMMQEFGQFLKSNDFRWGDRTSFFQRICFNSDGTIDYYFVNLDQSNLSKEKRAHLKKLLQEFSSDYQFPMKAESNFAQCVPITFVDPTTEKQKSEH